MSEAGSSWRLLVHDPDPNQPGHYTTAHHVTPAPAPNATSPWSAQHVIPGAVFDELVAGSWLHVEDMGPGVDDHDNEITDGSSVWWMQVAGATLWVEVDPEGRPVSLRYYPPGTYSRPRMRVRRRNDDRRTTP